MTLTKRDIIIRISKKSKLLTNSAVLNQQVVREVVQQTIDCIVEALSKGDRVELRNFGVFFIRVAKARIGRNPNKPGTDVPIPERAIVKFRMGKELRVDVLKLPTQVRQAKHPK